MTSILWIFSTGFSAGGPIRLKLFSAEGGEKRTSHPTNKNLTELGFWSYIRSQHPPAPACSPKHRSGPRRAQHELSRSAPFIQAAPQRGNAPFRRDVGQPLARPRAPHHGGDAALQPLCQAARRQVCAPATPGTKPELDTSLVPPHSPS